MDKSLWLVYLIASAVTARCTFSIGCATAGWVISRQPRDYITTFSNSDGMSLTLSCLIVAKNRRQGERMEWFGRSIFIPALGIAAGAWLRTVVTGIWSGIALVAVASMIAAVTVTLVLFWRAAKELKLDLYKIKRTLDSRKRTSILS